MKTFLTVVVVICFLCVGSSSHLDLPSLASLNDNPTLHLVIRRRGGSYERFTAATEIIDFTKLKTEMSFIGQRYSLTRRESRGNKLIRQPNAERLMGSEISRLISTVQQNGTWYATVSMGTPPQPVEVDLDMLTSDFYVLTTTSRMGTKYDDLFSSTIEKSSQDAFPECTVPTESFLLPSLSVPTKLQFAYCRPSKSSRRTLAASGSMIGLAASEKMSQIKSPSLISQLLQQGIIKAPIFSLFLLNGYEGVLSLGGTAHRAVEVADMETKAALDRLGAAASLDRQEENLQTRDLASAEKHQAWQESFKWAKLQGAEGWWQVLMNGVWVGERKVLKNQPVVVDVNSPLIIAPPAAAATFYSSIAGAYPLPSPHDGIYAFPCLNPPSLAFEFESWNFPVMRGGRRPDNFERKTWGKPGGRLSIGKVANGSGFCVGAVVGVDLTRGEYTSNLHMAQEGFRNANLDGNGMKGVWVLGEPWMRGVNAVFDLKDQRIGFRST